MNAKRTLIVTAAVALTAMAGVVRPPASTDRVSEVETLERTRRAAMVDVDVNKLARIFASDGTYVHSTGLAQSRDDLLGMLTRGEIRYVSFDVESVTYRTYESTVVGTGVQSITLESSGKPLTSRSRYTVVYAPVHGEPKLVAYQSTPMPQIVMQEKVGDKK